ncbi:MAG TPA: hypothetical protein VHB73_06930 [Alphaproteobacteria bacterium]|nr:hypothetical protein [Alphaproteobacteria bacterium]
MNKNTIARGSLDQFNLYKLLQDYEGITAAAWRDIHPDLTEAQAHKEARDHLIETWRRCAEYVAFKCNAEAVRRTQRRTLFLIGAATAGALVLPIEIVILGTTAITAFYCLRLVGVINQVQDYRSALIGRQYSSEPEGMLVLLPQAEGEKTVFDLTVGSTCGFLKLAEGRTGKQYLPASAPAPA